VHVHGFGAIEADGLDAEAEFAFAGLTRGCVFETEIFGATELVEADDFWHENSSFVWFDEGDGVGIRERKRKFSVGWRRGLRRSVPGKLRDA
jgi:hypothetical protein